MSSMSHALVRSSTWGPLIAQPVQNRIPWLWDRICSSYEASGPEEPMLLLFPTSAMRDPQNTAVPGSFPLKPVCNAFFCRHFVTFSACLQVEQNNLGFFCWTLIHQWTNPRSSTLHLSNCRQNDQKFVGMPLAKLAGFRWQVLIETKISSVKLLDASVCFAKLHHIFLFPSNPRS